MKTLNLIILSAVFMLIVAACSYEPQDIRYGEEECAHCRMIISEPKFAAQMVTDKGRHFSFDAIECLAAYVIKEPYAPAEAYKLWVPYFENPENWIEAQQAIYLQTGELPSPMGLHFSAYKNIGEAEQFQSNYGGEIFEWGNVKKIVNRKWFNE